MEKNITDRKIILFFSILLILFLIGVFLHIKMNKSYDEFIDMNWSIKLPKPYKEIYSADSGLGSIEDSERYHIFEYKEEDIVFFLKWKGSKDIEFESVVEKILNELSVDSEYMPNFEMEYKYYSKKGQDSSKIYLIFFPDMKRLYVIEDFILEMR